MYTFVLYTKEYERVEKESPQCIINDRKTFYNNALIDFITIDNRTSAICKEAELSEEWSGNADNSEKNLFVFTI